MATNRDSTIPQRMCEKVSGAIRPSSPTMAPAAAGKLVHVVIEGHEIHTGPGVHEKDQKRSQQDEKYSKAKIAATQDIKVEQKEKKAGPDINDRVSDYISRARSKMRAITMRRGGTGEAENNSGNDHFTDYIRRIKMRMRTKSGISGGKDVAAK